MTNEELQTLRERLLIALGRPEHEIEFEGRRMQFKGTTEVLKAISALEGAMASVSDSRGPRKFTLSTSEGLWPASDCCCGGGQ